MKIIDEDNDYFLHDFSAGREDASASSDAGAQTQASDTPEAPRSQTFDYGVTTPEPAAPKPRRHPVRRFFTWLLVILIIAAGVAFYVRYFVPHTTDTRITGFVTNVEKRGIIFKTFEGEMVSESRIADPSQVYQRDVYFSIPDDSTGRVVQSFQGTGRPVVITVKKYYGTLPWRGASKVVLTDIHPK